MRCELSSFPSVWQHALISAPNTNTPLLSPCEFLSKPLSSHGLPLATERSRERRREHRHFRGAKRKIGQAKMRFCPLCPRCRQSRRSLYRFRQEGGSIEARRAIPLFPFVSYYPWNDLERGLMSIEIGTVVLSYRCVCAFTHTQDPHT